MGEHAKENAIDRYLNGQMGETEKKVFESRMAADPSLRLHVEEKLLNPNSHTTTDTSTNKISPLTAKRVRREARLKTLRRLIRVVTGLAALAFFIWIAVIAYSFYSLSPDDIFKRTFINYELIDPPGKTMISDSIQLNYAAADYTQVIKKFRKASVLTPKEYLITGVSYLQLDDPFHAISPLRKVVQTPNVYKEDGEFYLALAYLKNKDYDRAYEMMEKIHNNPSHLYNNKFDPQVMKEVQMLKWR